MPTLFHLSDLHFGPWHDTHLNEIILQEIAALNPDAVIVSGDFTMRARHSEFEQARAWLAQIAKPTLLIPGNHDQPVFDPLERLTNHFGRYQKYIHPEINTVLSIDGLVVLGLNDNHPILPGGFWSLAQRAWIVDQLARAPRAAAKILATHHQLAWEGKWRPAGFWYPTRALELLARGGVELVLNGHTHVPTVVETPQGIIVARAGTAMSTRTRHGHGNSYNYISVDSKQISIFVRRYDERADAFIAARAFAFPRRANLG